MGCAIGKDFHIAAKDVAIGSNNFTLLRVPHQQLPAWHGHGVEFVDVARLAGAAASGAERNFAQAPYFAHGVGSGVSVHHINFIATLIGAAQQASRGEFAFYERKLYGRYDGSLFHAVHLSVSVDGWLACSLSE